MLNACPPVDAVNRVCGQPPAGAGMMSAGSLRSALRALADTTSRTYGFVFDARLWQMAVRAVLAVEVAVAVEIATAASSPTNSRALSRFIVPPRCCVAVSFLYAAGAEVD